MPPCSCTCSFGEQQIVHIACHCLCGCADSDNRGQAGRHEGICSEEATQVSWEIECSLICNILMACCCLQVYLSDLDRFIACCQDVHPRLCIPKPSESSCYFSRWTAKFADCSQQLLHACQTPCPCGSIRSNCGGLSAVQVTHVLLCPNAHTDVPHISPFAHAERTSNV